MIESNGNVNKTNEKSDIGAVINVKDESNPVDKNVTSNDQIAESNPVENNVSEAIVASENETSTKL